MQIFIAVVLVVVAYALGTFPSAAIVAGKQNLDITKVGSGNPGASNVIRNLGWKTGLAVFLLDMAKAAIAVGLAWIVTDDRHDPLSYLCLFAAILGHSYPVTRKFKGGKGVASGGGGMFVLFPLTSLVLFSSWFVLTKATHKASIASLTISIALPFGIYYEGATTWEIAATLALVGFIIVKHLPNLRRLKAHEEPDIIEHHRMLAIIASFFEWLKESSSSPWFYVVIFVIATLDSVLPIVPSETLVIIGGVTAGAGDLSIALVILCGAGGAFVGDNLSYLLGREASDWVVKRRTRTEKGAKQLANIVEQIHERGGLLLITARFIPGGRTLLTLSCGVTRQPRKWFVGWAVIAAIIWSTYASLLGFIGGKSFADNHTKAFLIAFASAFSVTFVIEVVRLVLKKQKHNK